MKTYTLKSLFDGEDDTVYVFETLEDWDEYEKYLNDLDPDYIKKYNPNFYQFKEDFKKYIGKIWQDRSQIRYLFNGVPVYAEYRIIALEDNNPFLDWYWVVQNVNDDKDTRRILALMDIKDDIKRV